MRTASDGHVFEPANWPQAHLCKWCFEPVAPHLTATHNPVSYVDLPKGAEMITSHAWKPREGWLTRCAQDDCLLPEHMHSAKIVPLPRVIFEGAGLRVVEVERNERMLLVGQTFRNERRFTLERKGDPDALGVSGWSAAERVTPDEAVEAILSLVEGAPRA